ncbi:hypothetical protein [Leeuwenhoekiella sp. ZYFB001]|uniref:hypothetical protein n=1 Tax=Leeuwenhoekiella sp. ZYFB001 TaxID=2719912 RepID=UPI001430FE7F|nr:hypothetical protein [Leeuwenhoekiella sp. ZYFB001]
MKANKKQKQLIHVNAPNRDTKEEWVQWATGDNDKISTNDLTYAQANAILKQMGLKPVPMATADLASTWGKFDKNNQRHKAILSLLIQIKWTTDHPRFGRVADITRFGAWLQSDRAPVRKPLLKMHPEEVSKIINALEGILKSLYK